MVRSADSSEAMAWQVRAGTSDEFCEFVASRSAALVRLAYMLVGDHELAQDLVQESLARVYVAWPRLRDVANAEAYTRRVITTTAISWRRRRSFHERPVEVLREPPSADPADDLVVHEALWAHLLHCRRASARRSCCATTPICRRHRPRRRWAARSAR